MKRRILIFILTIALAMAVVLAVPALDPGSQAYAETSGDFEYEINDDGTATITGYTGSDTEIVVPAELDGYQVTSLGESAFDDCNSLTGIVLPDSLTSICEYAFSNCTGLTSIELPDSVTEIGYCAFKNCTELSSVNYPVGLREAGEYIFVSCSSLKSITVPEGVSDLPDNVFYGCNCLESITLPGKLKSIGNNAFEGCSSLKSITVPEGVSDLPDNVFYDCYRLESITLPSMLKSIGNNAFEGCTGLTGIDLPDSLESIGYYAFSSCGLTSIDLPDSLTSIGGAAFNSCTRLSSIEFPDSLKSIDYGVFSDCESLTSIELPDSVISIGKYAFSRCKNLISIVLPNSVTSIGEYAFYNCDSLASIVLPDSLEFIRNRTFSDCESLTSIEVPDSVTYIGEYAFYNCKSLTIIDLPDGLTSIGHSAFAFCSNLTSVQLPDGVTTIEEEAFYFCLGLTDLKLPDSVTSIGDGAFNQCSGLTSVKLSNGLTSIGDNAFAGCYRLTSIELPDGLTSIGESAFSGCESLTSIEVPDSVTYIGSDTFYGCGDLTIYGKAGSYAETYAKDNNIPFSTGPVAGWNDPTYEWSEDYSSVTATRVSKSVPSVTESETVETTSEVTKEPACEAKGVTTYTTKAFENSAFEVQSKEVENINALGHDWGEPAWTWAEDHSSAEAVFTCTRCNDKKTVTAAGKAITSEVTKEAAVDEEGERIYTAVVTFEDTEYADTATEVIPALPSTQVKDLQALAFSEKIRINWQPVDGAEGYYIYVDYKDGDKYTEYKTYSTSKTNCNFTSLKNDRTYRFKVRAYKTVNGSKVYGEYSDEVSAVPYDDAVQNLKAASYDQKVRLTWDAVKNAEGYNIYAMYADGSKYKTYDTTKTSCSFTKLTNGNKYQFKIREYKVDSTGTKVYASKYSSSVSATPRMDAVSGFKALPFSQKVNVSWDAMDKADGYYVNVVNSNGTLYKNYSTTKTSVNFNKLTNGKTYKFRVRAYELNSKGSKVYGKYTSYKSVKPYNDKVTGLKAVPGTNKIALSWTAVDKAEGYNIYAMYADGSKYKTYNTVKTTCNFNNLKTGDTYQFKVREYKVNAAGSKVYGAYSSVVKAKAK